LLSVRNALISAGLADEATDFIPLKGGRTNRLWRYEYLGGMLVCKLFQNSATPLFPNDPDAEAKALMHLVDAGLAPDFLARVDCEIGTILIYRHVPGPCWSGEVTAVAHLLSRLHAIPQPAGLRQITTGTKAILAQGSAMLDFQTAEAKRLMCLKPNLADPPPSPNVFLHGDVVAQNIIENQNGLRLIDWQCPAIGDATEDLAIFLSPAMQHIYGERALSETEENAFLDEYDHADCGDRYRHLSPAYHWRMAAYCLWKAERGDAIYREGFEREIARLEHL